MSLLRTPSSEVRAKYHQQPKKTQFQTTTALHHIAIATTILATLLYHVPSMFLEYVYYPAYGYMMPNAIQTFTPRTDVLSDSIVTNKPWRDRISADHFPRIAHVTYKSREELPEDWKASLDRWNETNPAWELRFWTDDDILDFVEESFPNYASMFARYKYTIQRVDAVRYMILSKYGGVYSDLDIHPQRSLDSMLEQFEDQGKNVILSKTLNAGVTNAFMASVPDSAFMNCVVDNLPKYQHQSSHLFGWRHWEVLSSAGSTFLWGMMGRCDDNRVGVLSTESFRSCSVCDWWGKGQKGSDATLGEDGWCNTEWLHHGNLNSTWHESKSLYHEIWLGCTMFLFCNPFGSCLVVAYAIVFFAIKAIQKRFCRCRIKI